MGAFVGIDGFGVGMETGDVGGERDAVAAHHFAGQGHGFAHHQGRLHLGQGGVLVPVDALGLLFGQPDHQGKRGGDVAEHPGQFFLDQLEGSQRAAELPAFRHVGEGGFERAGLDAGGDPGNVRAHGPQHRGHVLEGVHVVQAHGLRHPDARRG